MGLILFFILSYIIKLCDFFIRVNVKIVKRFYEIILKFLRIRTEYVIFPFPTSKDWIRLRSEIQIPKYCDSSKAPEKYITSSIHPFIFSLCYSESWHCLPFSLCLDLFFLHCSNFSISRYVSEHTLDLNFLLLILKYLPFCLFFLNFDLGLFISFLVIFFLSTQFCLDSRKELK